MTDGEGARIFLMCFQHDYKPPRCCWRTDMLRPANREPKASRAADEVKPPYASVGYFIRPIITPRPPSLPLYRCLCLTFIRPLALHPPLLAVPLPPCPFLASPSIIFNSSYIFLFFLTSKHLLSALLLIFTHYFSLVPLFLFFPGRTLLQVTVTLGEGCHLLFASLNPRPLSVQISISTALLSHLCLFICPSLYTSIHPSYPPDICHLYLLLLPSSFIYIHSLISSNLPPSPWFPPLSIGHMRNFVTLEFTYLCFCGCTLSPFFFFFLPFSIHPSPSTHLSLPPLRLHLSPFSGDPAPITIWTPPSPFFSLPLFSLCLPADSSLSESRPILRMSALGRKRWCHLFQRRRAQPALSHNRDTVVYMMPPLLEANSVTQSFRHSVWKVQCLHKRYFSWTLIHNNLRGMCEWGLCGVLIMLKWFLNW